MGTNLMLLAAMLFADGIDFNGIATLVTAIASAVAAIYAARAHWAAAQAKVASESNKEAMAGIKTDVAEAKVNIQKVETATNSMKDALVKATGDAAFLEGEKSGKEQGTLKPHPEASIAPVHMEVEHMQVETLNVPPKKR